MATKFLLIALILYCPSYSSQTAVHITNGSQLVQYLCHSVIKDDLHLVLVNTKSSPYLVADSLSFCEVNANSLLTMTINSTSNDSVIKCSSKIGFLFIGISITIDGVTFEACGAPLQKINNPSIVSLLNTTETFYLLDKFAAAVIFINSQVSISSSVFNVSSGFAIIGVNLLQFDFFSGYLDPSEKCEDNLGSGFFLYFSDASSSHQDVYVNIQHSSFRKQNSHICCASHNCAEMITLVYAQSTFKITTMVSHNKFQFSKSSAVLVRCNYAYSSSTTIKKCIFKGYGHGAIFTGQLNNTALRFDNTWPAITIDTTSFFLSRGIKINITAMNKISTSIFFSSVGFINNKACIFVQSDNNSHANISVFMAQIIAFNNSVTLDQPTFQLYGLFIFKSIHTIHSDSSKFQNNYGSLIAVNEASIIFRGNSTFLENAAQFGAAIYLINSQILLNGTYLRFCNNTAIQSGGAIYAFNRNGKHIFAEINGTVNYIYFVTNAAFMSGNSIYAVPLNIEKALFQKMNFSSINNSLHEISTEAETTTLCPNQSKHIDLYAGQKITIFLKAQDKLNRSVQSSVFFTIAKASSKKSPHFHEVYKSDWHMPIIENYQLIEEKKDNTCTALNLTLLTNDNNPYQGVIIVDLSLKSSDKTNRIEHPINFHSCPFGFENKGNGICECDTLITAPSRNCDISSKNITSRDISWIGKYNRSNNESTLAYTKYCPIGYCIINRLRVTSSTIKVNDDNVFEVVRLNNEVSVSSKFMCESNRGGVLCGECTNGTSIVLGPDNCHVCSDWWLLTLMVYLISGPLLIYLLYALKLTITTGTINGIIFYAQAANCGLIDILQYPKYRHEGYLSSFSTIAIAFLKFLNLEVGYPICLYNGMNMLFKMYFSFVQTLYSLSILLLIVIFSRYSTRLSNYIANSSIQVLVTVLHISFYKIIDSVVIVFSYNEVYTKAFGTINVWTYDGSVVYFSKEHVALMIFTLFIAAVLLVPYIVLLLGGRVLLKYSDKFRPVYEAIHGPYKEKKNYWFTARLFLLIAINIIYISLRSVNPIYIVLFTSVLLIVFTIIQAHIRPFKNHLINMLDLLVMVLFLFQYIFTWFGIYYESSHWNYVWVFVASVLLLFIVFIAVIFGHVFWVTGKYKKVKDLFHRDMSHSALRINIHRRRVRINSCNDDSYYQSCDIRDSLLDSY